jgi:hypothetical protein
MYIHDFGSHCKQQHEPRPDYRNTSHEEERRPDVINTKDQRRGAAVGNNMEKTHVQVFVHDGILDTFEVSFEWDNEIVPRNLRPVMRRPTSLSQIGVTEGQARNEFDVIDPNLVDSVTGGIEVG